MIIKPLIKNNVNLVGDSSKPVMVFAHGFGTDQTTWRFIIEKFKNDFFLILYDNTGGGKSLPEAYSNVRYSNIQSYSDDLLDILSELKVANVTMVCHSFSCMMAMHAYFRAPEYFSKFIFIGASPRYLNEPSTGYVGGFEKSDIDKLLSIMEQNYFVWASGFAEMVMKNPNKPEFVQEFANTLKELRPDIAIEVSKVIFFSDYRNKISSLLIPTLILQTFDDIAVPVEVGSYLHKHIPNSILKSINATGHFPQIVAPEEIIQEIKLFL